MDQITSLGMGIDYPLLAQAPESSSIVDVALKPPNYWGLAHVYPLLVECADHDVVTIWIPERKLPCSCSGVHMRLLVESGDKSAGPLECHIEIIDTKKQE